MPVNPKSIENLRPWQPGETGSPGGRPSKRPITIPCFQQAGELVLEIICLQLVVYDAPRTGDVHGESVGIWRQTGNSFVYVPGARGLGAGPMERRGAALQA